MSMSVHVPAYLSSDKALEDFLRRANPMRARMELLDVNSPIRDNKALAYDEETERLLSEFQSKLSRTDVA